MEPASSVGQAEDAAQQRGLPRSVGAEDSHDVAVMELEIEVADDGIGARYPIDAC